MINYLVYHNFFYLLSFIGKLPHFFSAILLMGQALHKEYITSFEGRFKLVFFNQIIGLIYFFNR